MKRIKNTKTPTHPEMEGDKAKRRELVKQTTDKILNISRAIENVGEKCIICGNEIRKNQTFRVLPKDKNCQRVRLYHLRTCGPGSNNWNAFKFSGKKTPDEASSKSQLSFRWKEKKH